MLLFVVGFILALKVAKHSGHFKAVNKWLYSNDPKSSCNFNV